MRTRRPSPEHEAAIDRRLALLGDELAGVRPARPGLPTSSDPATPAWWDDHTRQAPPRRPPDPPPRPRPLPGSVPSPGRHAARRSALPAASLRGVGLGPAQLAVVAVVVALGLAVTCAWLVRGSADPAPELAAAPVRGLVTSSPVVQTADESVGDAPSAAAAAAATAGAGTVTVDVTGKVRHPGIAVLDHGARVVDALAAAGGARPGADLTGLNLARVLADGEQVVVGEPAPSGVAAAAVPTPGPSSAGPAALVNLNSASEAELDTLPEVGPVTAASILAWRDEHGGFTSVEELLEVDGIGEVTLDRVAPFVTV
jgi:competence protein ComEA